MSDDNEIIKNVSLFYFKSHQKVYSYYRNPSGLNSQCTCKSAIRPIVRVIETLPSVQLCSAHRQLVNDTGRMVRVLVQVRPICLRSTTVANDQRISVMFGGGAVSYKAFGVHGLAQSQHHRAPGGNLGADTRCFVVYLLPFSVDYYGY